ncbi:MAG: hypothetical protein WDN45_08550 [Caulobacteraceae bacterium]
MQAHILQPPGAADQQFGAVAAQIGQHALGHALAAQMDGQGMDRAVEGGGGAPGRGIVAGGQGLAGGEPGQLARGQGGGGAGGRGGERIFQGLFGGSVQAIVAKEVGAEHGAQRLFAAGGRPGLDARSAAEALERLFRPERGAAQGFRITGAAGQFAPDAGGFQTALIGILGADAAGGDVGGAGFVLEQVEAEHFEQGGIAAGQAVAAGRLGFEQAFQLSTELEHQPAPHARRVHGRHRDSNARQARPEPRTERKSQ